MAASFTFGALNLLDGTKHKIVNEWVFQDGVLTIPLLISGTTMLDLGTNQQNINKEIQRARVARGPYGLGTLITCDVVMGGTAGTVSFDVLDGYLQPGKQRPWLNQMFATLVLQCLPCAHGTAVTVTTTGAITQSNGAYATPGGTGNAGVFISGVTGDCAAPVTMVLSDTSSGGVINRVHWSRVAVSVSGAVTGDYDHILDSAATGAGTTATDGTAYMGGSFVRLNPTADYQTFASFVKPTAAYLNGEFDVVVRVRDSSAILGAAPVLASAINTSFIASYRQTVNNTGTGSSATIAWPSATLLGNLLEIKIKLNSRTVTITTPTGWTAGPAVAHASGAVRVATFYISEAAARSGTETITLSGSATWDVYMIEIVGIAYATPLDQSITNTATTAITVAATTGTLAQANEWITSVGGYDGTVAGSTFSTTFAAGGEIYDSADAMNVGYSYATATTLHSNTHSKTGANVNLVVALASYKTQANAAAAMPAGNYQVRVAAKNAAGGVGSASNIVSVTKTTTGTLRVEWAAPAGATVDSYRVYFKRDALAWKYFDMPATKAYLTWILTTESGATTGDPVTGSSTNSGVFRLGVALPSGTTIHWGSPFSAPLGNSNWENVLAPDRLPAPPVVAVDGGTPQNFIFYLQGKHIDEVGTLDVDVLALFRAPDGVASVSGIAEYVGLGLATARDWHISQRRDGWVAGYLTTTGTSTDAGEIDVSGELSLMPGSNWLMFFVAMATGVSLTGGPCSYTVAIQYLPQFTFLKGA